MTLPKKKTISFGELEKMNSIEFINKKWKRTEQRRGLEVEFAWRNFKLHFAYFGSDEDQINVTLIQVKKIKKDWDVQEAWGKTVNAALRDLESSVYQIASLTR